jgi:PIN domain nuclease of toxin-antitoxin system
MRLLLDTHTVIWSATGDPRLTPGTLAILGDPRNELLLSPISVYEMAIKVRLGKLNFGMPLSDFVDEAIRRTRLIELPIRIGHALATQALPPHHKDPFDRLLIATCIAEGIGFVTADSQVRKYPVTIIWQP